MIDLKEQRTVGWFIGETETHWIFQESELDYSTPANKGKIAKKNFKGIPPMNEPGDLRLDNSYNVEKIDGEFYFTQGEKSSGLLITFMPFPF